MADILSLFLDNINANFTRLFNLGPCLVLQDSWANIYPRPTVRYPFGGHVRLTRTESIRPLTQTECNGGEREKEGEPLSL